MADNNDQAVPSTPISTSVKPAAIDSAVAVTSTPSTGKRTSRRSARVHKRDPIVAPGFGTQKDLSQLSNDLGLPEAAIKAIMESRGRGILGKSKGDEEEKPPPTPISTAWADFMQDEGFDKSGATTTAATGVTTTTAAAATATTSATTTKTSGRRSEQTQEKAKANRVEPGMQRTYDLPIEPKWMFSTDSEPSAKKQKTSDRGGVLAQTGTLDAATVGRTKRTMDRSYDVMVPTLIMPSLKNIVKVITSSNACHSIAITSTGQAYGWGRNEAQQLGGDLPANVPLPTLLTGVENIVDGAVGKAHTILLDSKGQPWAVGSNKLGQCGIKSSIESVANFRKCVVLAKDVNIIQIACGEQFSVALSTEGYLYTTGSSQFGQLGNGETGEHFISASKIGFSNCSLFTRRSIFCHAPGEKNYGGYDNSIKVVPLTEDIRLSHVACGKYHAVAVEAPSGNEIPRVFSWGCGDYGCLGHGKQADEYLPRMIGLLSTGHMFDTNFAVTASAGAQCSMILTKRGHVYYFGKHRSIGEATMRPNLLDELANNGHVVTHVDGGAQTVVCSTANGVTVSWGQGPHGELGYGLEQKSSSRPKFVPALDSCIVSNLACGYGHTLFILQNEDADDEKALKQLKELDEGCIAELEATLGKAKAPTLGKAKTRK